MILSYYFTTLYCAIIAVNLISSLSLVPERTDEATQKSVSLAKYSSSSGHSSSGQNDCDARTQTEIVTQTTTSTKPPLPKPNKAQQIIFTGANETGNGQDKSHCAFSDIFLGVFGWTCRNLRNLSDLPDKFEPVAEVL